MFYEIFIEFRISQIKNFQTIIERHFVNTVKKKQTEYPHLTELIS